MVVRTRKRGRKLTASEKAKKHGVINHKAVKDTPVKEKSTRKRRPKATPGAVLCQCGCGEEVAKGRTFRQGHDARFHGRVAKLKDGRLTMTELKPEIEAYAVKFYTEAVGKRRRRTAKKK